MNYFAHAYAFLDRADLDPHFVAGTAVPDWLTVSDRQVRVRARHVQPLLAEGGSAAALARGMIQHWADDAHFHATRAFVETSLGLAVLARDALREDEGLRGGFLGHLLTELLLDASLIAPAPGRLERYYELLETLDGDWIETAVNRVAPRPTRRLAAMILGFRRERVLWDYLEDGKLLLRLNQVMRRLGLGELPDRLAEVLPEARRRVESRKTELLEGIPSLGTDAGIGPASHTGRERPG
jgi:hypothetical protein